MTEHGINDSSPESLLSNRGRDNASEPNEAFKAFLEVCAIGIIRECFSWNYIYPRDGQLLLELTESVSGLIIFIFF